MHPSPCAAKTVVIRLVYLFFIHSSCSSSSDLSFSLVPRQYMVLVPFLIHSDSHEKVCIQLTHLNESVTLSATLEHLGENRSLIDDVVSEKDVFTCIPFSVSISSLWDDPLCQG